MKTYKNVHIQQHDQSDCGVACLASILKYYGGEAPLERIREWSGTSASGTTLLGLLQAAQKLKLDAEGFEAEVKHLRELENPAILHVIKNQELPHFIICYQYQEANDSFLISDPAEPYIQELSAEAIDRMWVTKTLLLVKPTDQIRQKGPATNRNRLKWVFDFTRPDLNLLLSSLVLGLIVSILSLSVAVFSQKLVDVILPSQNLGKLIAGAALLLFLLLVRSLVGYLRQVFLTTQSRAFNIRILDYFYNKLLFLPKPFFDNRKTGDLVARMNDTARIQETISILFSSLAIDLIMVVVSSVALLFYSLSIGLLSLIWIPLFGLIVWRFSKQVIHRQRGVMVGYAMNESNYIDTIQGVGVIKVKGREKVFESLTRRIYTLFQEARYQLGLTGIRFGISAQVAGSIFMVGMIVYSSWLVMEGHLTVGGVMAVIQLLGLSMASVATIANAYINLQEARIALDRMREFTELEPEYDPEEEGQKQALPAFERLSVQGLDFRFTGRPLLLENISFDLQKGEMIALMGKAAAGKVRFCRFCKVFWSLLKEKLK
jgi:ABC-type bacteriocin/lantibiotic exporter with double-glycine peptidase domain